MAVGLDLAESQGLVPAGAGTLAQEVDPVYLSLRHRIVKVTGFRDLAQAGGLLDGFL
jgi:hypothetical protein